MIFDLLWKFLSNFHLQKSSCPSPQNSFSVGEDWSSEPDYHEGRWFLSKKIMNKLVHMINGNMSGPVPKVSELKTKEERQAERLKSVENSIKMVLQHIQK